MKKRPVEDISDLAKIVADGVEALLKILNEKQQDLNRKMIESIKIDFDELLNLISIIQESGKQPDAKDFQNYFYLKWIKETPPIFVKIMEGAIEEGSLSAKEFRDEIMSMGSKLKTIIDSNLCVSPVMPPDCENCYFSSICKSKI